MSTITWAGAGPHEGHTITPTDVWAPHVEPLDAFGSRGLLTCGRVRCSCGAEWNVSGWPPEHYDELEPPRAGVQR